MRSWPLFAAGMILMAGCIEAETEAAAPMVEPVSEGPVAEPVVASYELVLTAVKTPVNNANSGGQNCLMFGDRGMITGTATVTWAHEPGMPEMELVLTGADDLQFRTGTGEIVLEIDAFEVGRDTGGSLLAWQASQGALAGAVVEVAATLELDLEFLPARAGGEFDPEDGWTCSVGH
jgi:hypothetical protein